ncbi:MAG: sugar transferase [Clostridiales bacterium]|nr:sugar transferase [Clostridiales bacterium]
MRSLFNEIGLRLLKSSNLLFVSAPFIVSWYLYYASRISSPFYFWGNLVVFVLFMLLYFYFARTYDAFFISHNTIGEIVTSQSLSAFLADTAMYFVIILLSKRLVNPLPLMAAFAVQFALSAFWSLIANLVYYRIYPAKKTLIINDVRRDMDGIIRKYHMERKFDISKSVSVEECLNDLSVIDDVEVVFLSGVHTHERNIILKYCMYNDKLVYMIPRVGDVIMSGAQQVHLFHLPMLRTGGYRPNPEYVITKRLFDIIASVLGLIVLSPLFLVVAIVIKASDKGPVFYRQERLTKDGKRFMIHKFRSMRADAEKDGIPRLSSGVYDDRITPVGRFIRRCRIDELPQLFDILTGNLSVVGPRPERPEIAEEYMKEMPEFQLRLQAKAGLTGYAQIYGKYNTTPYDKLQLDLMYIAHPSLAEDIRICFATIRILFKPSSTEGVAPGQTTALEKDEEDMPQPGV